MATTVLMTRQPDNCYTARALVEKQVFGFDKPDIAGRLTCVRSSNSHVRSSPHPGRNGPYTTRSPGRVNRRRLERDIEREQTTR